eukprot:6200933-Pleurochrysis_carterae.AAC.4
MECCSFRPRSTRHMLLVAYDSSMQALFDRSCSQPRAQSLGVLRIAFHEAARTYSSASRQYDFELLSSTMLPS